MNEIELIGEKFGIPVIREFVIEICACLNRIIRLMDILEIVKASFEESRERTIKEYREFFVLYIHPLGNKPFSAIRQFLKDLERQPAPILDQDFSVLQGRIRVFTESTFGKALLIWYKEECSEVKEITNGDQYTILRMNEISWIQHRTKLTYISEMFNAYGLHPDISKRDVGKYGRYNAVIEYLPRGAAKARKECKGPMSKDDLERQVLSPHRCQTFVRLNGKSIPASEITRYTITRTVLLDEEIPLYKARYNCRTDLAFCKHFPDVTDSLIHNVEVAEPQAEIPTYFIDPSRIAAFKAYTGTLWDLSKLATLCEELNHNFHAGQFYSVAYLSRALMDHIAPILGFKSFSEVANNYAGDRSFKKAAAHLENTLRNVVDLHIHKQIGPKLPPPAMTQIDFRQDFDFVLGELLTKL